MSQKQIKKFEFDGLMQDIHRKEKGSKSCKEPHTSFAILTRPITNMEMDELVDFSQYDKQLAEGIKWIDEEAQKRKISFYEMAFIVLHRADVKERAKSWLQTKEST